MDLDSKKLILVVTDPGDNSRVTYPIDPGVRLPRLIFDDDADCSR